MPSSSSSSSSASIPNVSLNDGTQIPIIGLGTFQAPKGETQKLVTQAIKIGYRHFDCADFYENEDEVGAGLADALAAGIVRREQLFITTKIWPNWFGPGRPTLSVKRSLRRLRLDYVDLLLIHWPTALMQDDDRFYPVDENNRAILNEDIDILDVWREFEQIKAKGLARSIGVSNFNAKQIQRLIDHSSTIPAVDQVESHPFLSQAKLLKYCDERGVRLTAYSPLARSGTAEVKNTPISPLEHETIRKIAATHRVSAAQICIRWQAQRGVIVIPKSSNIGRVETNFDIFGFELADAEMGAIDALNCDCRNNTWTQFGIDRHKDYPFSDEF